MAFDVRLPTANEINRVVQRKIVEGAQAANIGLSRSLLTQAAEQQSNPITKAALSSLARRDFPPGAPPEPFPRAATTAQPRSVGAGIPLAQVREIVRLLVEGAQRDIAAAQAQKIVLPPERLDSAGAGGLGLRGFIAPNRRAPMVTDIEAALRPVQEMAAFQWELRDEGSSLTPGLGDASQWTFTVPEGRAVQVKNIGVIASAARRFVGSILNPRLIVALPLFDFTVAANQLMAALYVDNAESVAAATATERWLGDGEGIQLYDGDQLRVSTDVAAGAETATLQLRYRFVPPPKTSTLGEDLVGAVI